jgi:hypothetical protein
MQDCGINLIQTVVNPRVVRLTGNLADYRPIYDDNGVITEITCNSISYKVGTVFKPKRGYAFKINHIIQYVKGSNIICYDLVYALRNKSSYFILPLMGGSRKLFLWDQGLINAFVGTPFDDNCIALLYRFSGDVLFSKFEKALESFRNFRRRMDPDPYHVMFIFDLTEEMENSYLAFKEGKYSEMSDFYKLKIVSFHEITMDSDLSKILFKSPSLKQKLEEELQVTIHEDAELYDKPDMSIEIFNTNYYETKFKK